MTNMKRSAEKDEEIYNIYEEELNKYINNIFCNLCLSRFGRITSTPNVLRCTKNKCRKKRLLFNKKPFFNSSISFQILIKLLYLLLYGFSLKCIKLLLQISSKSIRKVVKSSSKFLKSDYMIGGENIIVEIDESKFGKRKYQRGHKVDGVWVLGMVERTSQRNIVLMPIKKRNKESLNKYILRHVRKGSIIYTDCWRGYRDLNKLGYRHYTVNHSKNFKDPNTGVHTNTIEGNWGAIKKTIPPRSRTYKFVKRYLKLFMFCRKFENRRFRMLIRFLLNL